MRRTGTSSWQIRTDVDQHLSTALYVRDVAGLRPEGVGGLDVGPLDPPVPVQPPTDDDLDLGLAARQWPTWWERALRRTPPTTLQEAHEAVPPSPPDWHDLQDLPALRALAQRHHRDVERWLEAPRRAEQERVTGRRGGDPLHMTRFVNAHGQRLGRPVRPFTLHLRLVPSSRPVGWVLDEQQVLLSTRLREDQDAVEALLAPVIAALA